MKSAGVCTMFVGTTRPKMVAVHRGKQGNISVPAISLRSPSTLRVDAMAAQENLPRLPADVKFRVLIIGRANAGKTSILQRVCDTTESPEIYSVDSEGVRKQVRSRL